MAIGIDSTSSRKERAATGVFDLADAPLLGAGEGAGFVAEEFAVEQGCRPCRRS
jgi:hypothetical protein